MLSRACSHTVALFLAAGGMLALGAAEGDGKEPQALGWRPPTAEEQAAYAEREVHITKVRYNTLATERIREAQPPQAGGAAAVALAVPVPLMEEIVGVVGPQPVRADPLGKVDGAGPAPGDPPLPAAVDNSLLPAFPPIRNQGSIGSCASFSTVYYQCTHMTGLARGWNQKGAQNSDAYRFSANWTYNMVNGGSDDGSFNTGNIEITIDHGIATWADFGYNNDFRRWSVDPALWRSALGYRMGMQGTIGSLQTTEGLYQLKQLLLNGYVLTMATYVSSWEQKSLGNDPATSADDSFAGQKVCRQVTGTSGGHAMTIVGYNDDVWLDVNANGAVDPGEKGALKIANSWGTGDWNGGYRWFAYDALLASTAVTGWTQHASRGQGFWSNQAYWVTARPAYTPQLVAEVEVSHAQRNQMTLYVGVSDTAASSPPANASFSGLSSDGGAFNFLGTTSTAAADISGTFALEYRDAQAPVAGSPRKYWVGFYDNGTAGSGTISAVRIKDASGTVLGTASGVPVVANGGTVWVPVTATYNPGAMPTVTVTASDAQAAELGDDTAVFTFTRSGSTSAALSVQFTVAGSASQGSDYNLIGNQVLLPAGSSSATVTVQPIRDTTNDGGETVTLTVVNAHGYTTGSPASATVIIVETTTPLAITTASLPPATVGVPYSVSLASINGTDPVTWGPVLGYAETTGGTYLGGGTGQNWKDDDKAWAYTLPWTFPFHGGNYSSVNISANGLIDFAASNSSPSNSAASLQGAPRIAPLWDDLRTDQPSATADIRITVLDLAGESDDAVVIRWTGQTYYGATAVDFECALYRNGRVAFRYGIAHSGLSPTIGLSGGTADTTVLASIDGNTSIAAGTSLLFVPSSLPGGMSVSIDGVLSGTPTTADISLIGFKATDATWPGPQTATASLSLTVQPATSGNTAPTISNVTDKTTAEDLATGAIAVTVGDAQTAVGSLVLTASSTNTTLVPNANFVLGGSGANRTVTITPATNQSGTATITLTVTDGGGLTASDSFVLTVTAVNDAPVNTVLPAITGTTTQGQTLTGSTGTWADVEGNTITYALQWQRADNSGGASLTDIGGANGATYALTAADVGKVIRLKVTATDNGSPAASGNAFSGYTVAVVGNSAPTISNVADTTTTEDIPPGTIAVTVGDAQTAVGSLVLSASSSNATLVPAASIALGGSGAARTVIITPAADQSGTATITLTVTDGDGLTAVDTFVLTVTAVNDAPVNTMLPVITGTLVQGQTLSGSTGTWADVEGNAITYVRQWQRADNSGGASLADIAGANAQTYVLTATDVGKVIRLKVTGIDNGTAPASSIAYSAYTATVVVSNTPPTISNVADLSVSEDTTTGAIAVTVGDAQTAVGSLALAASSSDQALVANANIVLGGSGANRTVTITPVANQSGTATITLTVTDGSGATVTDTFVLTVNTVNDAPTVSAVDDQTTIEDTATNPIAVVVGDIETAAGTLTLVATSSNTMLVPNSNIILGGSGTNRTVTITPAVNQSGVVAITLTVTDAGGLTASDTFSLTILAMNDAPTVSNVANMSTTEDTATGAIAITIGDVETPANSLTISAASSNTTLVPGANIVLGGSGANRTATITPAANKSGSATITLTVTDAGGMTATDTFLLTVTAVNDAPVNSALPVITGTATQGQTLNGTTGTWSDVETNVIVFARQWQRADGVGGGNLIDIPGATGATYVLTAADAGKVIRLKVTATDNGSPSAATVAYAIYTSVIVAIPTTATPTIGTATGTSTATPTLDGGATASSTIRIYDNGMLIGTATTTGGGAWTWTASPPLAAGTHNLTVTATATSGGLAESLATVAVVVSVPTATSGGSISLGNSEGGGGGGGCGAGGLVGLICSGLALFGLRRRR